MATNRINTPELAEELLQQGVADLVSLARPLLADAAFARKAEQGRADEINTCIACNQACLDHLFRNKVASCMVNPRACHETYYASSQSAARQARRRGRRRRRRLSLAPSPHSSAATASPCTKPRPTSAGS